MKELSVEEKAKAYDEVLKQIKECTPDENGFITIYPQEIFPELKESEDEKIRKEIIDFLKLPHPQFVGKRDHEKWIAWLEKQGKQKEYTFKSIPRLLDMIEPSDKTKAYCQKLIDTLTKEGYNTDAKIVKEVLKGWNGEDVPMAVMDKKQGEQKPDSFCREHCKGFQETGKCFADGDCKTKREAEQKPAWGEEDENTIKVLMNIIRKSEVIDSIIYTDSLKEKLYDWLNSLKQRMGGKV